MNRGIRVLQTLALPLGYVTIDIVIICELREKVHPFLKKFSKKFFRPLVTLLTQISKAFA